MRPDSSRESQRLPLKNSTTSVEELSTLVRRIVQVDLTSPGNLFAPRLASGLRVSIRQETKASRMDDTQNKKRCPYLKEVLMVYCEAYPVKKMVPVERIASANHCLGEEFPHCVLFEEIAARMAPPASSRPSRPSGEHRRRRRHAVVPAVVS